MTGTRLWVRCVHGLEDVVHAELVVRLGVTALERRPRSLFCDVDDPAGAVGLATVDDTLVLVAVVREVGPGRLALGGLQRAAADLDLRGPVDVTASFVGRRRYNRYDIEDAVGSQLPGPYASRRDGHRPPPDATAVRVHIEDDTGFIGVRVADGPLHRRGYKGASVPGTLHPPVAAALSVLGGLTPGDVLVDPTCGVGTIVVEAMRWNPTVPALGLDVSRDAVEGAAANGLSTVVQADAGASPLRSGCADVVAMNPPWGRQADAVGLLHDGPDTLWREAQRVVHDGGCVVVLTEEDLDAGLEVSGRVPLSLMGARPVVTVYGPEPPAAETTIRSLLGRAPTAEG